MNSDGSDPRNVSNNGFQEYTPAWSPDGSRLYFATDLPSPESQGGIDLWYSDRNGTFWEEPINLGPTVNTTGDEVFPSFYLANVNKKLLHFVGILQNKDNELSAIFETVLAHMDLNARKVTEFSQTKLNHILEYKKNNALNQELPFEVKLKIRNL